MSAPKILSTGRCLPRRIVTNQELSRQVDTNDEWVYSRTGIHQRHFCEGESGLDLALGAARKALERAGLKGEDIGVCLVATFTPDYASPSMACMLQKELGMKEDTVCFDLNAACAGFLYGLKTAHALLSDAPRPYALLVGCEVISRVLDMTDRNTCVLFGDGAGAAVLRRDEEASWHTVFGSRGDPESIWVQGPGPEPSAVHMEGKAVFRFAVEVVEQSIRQMLAEEGCDINDLDLVVCHQANARIIDHVAKKLKAREGLFYKNMDRYGNTSAASIPMALDELVKQGVLKSGMRVLTVGFGGGLTWAGALLRW
ncbi:ketoacyl-ACP synthase III [Pseudoflavonifractor sp. AF19-9AC]|uniref:beta-ketoacyl-ACP synthase III n=1 Tax=Pseudoflavonifractor sp. AF19-9AC TaxID=2292244 RepID=UPI000E48C2E1|nr:beta-ketoacyl-ACP synthase III [Pseudoflavonifractor sp. AF19-9AC]RHR10191.1 ketoacyl-ACP synthase III [Pseudoflavonifractor sp. AF19-9AC]